MSPGDSAPAPWLEPAWSAWCRAVVAGRRPHALLIRGPAGVGKRQLADLIANSLLCETVTAAAPCGHCRSCRLLHGGVHPDRLEVAPAAPGKAVLVDQIRRLPAFLSLKSQYRAPKVAILPEADRMNVSAANSLLKTLEEPPGDSLMLLVAAQPSRLPATIRSRCQSLHVPQPARPIALQWLRHQGLGDRAACLLAAAEGRPLLALSLPESSLPERRLAVARALPDLAAGRCDPSALAEAWVETQPGPLPTLRCIMSVTRDALRQSFDGDGGSLENPDLAEFSAQLARSVSASDLARRLGESERLHTWLESPVVPRLQFEDLLLAWRDRDGTRAVTDGGVF